MLAMFDDFRRGWARGRAVPADAPQEAAGDAGKELRSLAEVTELADQLQARVDELEGERAGSMGAVLTEVLRLPGVKMWLLAKFHPDKHPHANEAERDVHTQNFQKVNAAYEIIEHGQ
jgi:hypothetical protein